MIHIDIRSVWATGGGEFLTWLLPTVLLANLAYLRGRTQLSFLRTLLAVIAMTAVVFVAMFLSLLIWILVYATIPTVGGPDTATPVTLLVVILLSTLIATALQSAVLRVFQYEIFARGFLLLGAANFCSLALAGYRMISFAVAHPPEA